MFMCIYIHIHLYYSTYIHTCMHACMHAYMHTCIHAYMHTCIHADMHACMHTCIHTYIHACMHACMQCNTICIHTDILKYIYIYISTKSWPLIQTWVGSQSPPYPRECLGLFGVPLRCDAFFGSAGWVISRKLKKTKHIVNHQYNINIRTWKYQDALINNYYSSIFDDWHSKISKQLKDRPQSANFDIETP